MRKLEELAEGHYLKMEGSTCPHQGLFGSGAEGIADPGSQDPGASNWKLAEQSSDSSRLGSQRLSSPSTSVSSSMTWV